MIFRKIYFCQSQRTPLLIVLGTIMWLTAACTIPIAPANRDSQPGQRESPLIPGTNMALVENRWRLVEATYQGEAVEFDAISPIYLTFTVDGQLIKSTTNCNASGYYIIASSEQRYRLVPGAGTAQDCGESGNQQYAHITEAIAATTEYAMQNDQLLLMGDDVRIVLESDKP